MSSALPAPHPTLVRPAFPGRAAAALPRLLPGLALVLAIAAAALAAGQVPALAQRGLSALTLAVLAGIVLGNSVYPRLAAQADPGVAFAKHWFLRAGIVLYGLRLSLHDIAQLGWGGILVDAAVIVSTFGLACWVGQRWLGMEREQAALIGAGSAICGAAAVLATAPVLRARSETATVAVATVVVFGTLSMVLLPLVAAPLAVWLGSMPQLGLFIGSTVHEVAQVVAAGEAVGREAADMAVIAKMVRVMMLAPFLLVLSWWLARSERQASAQKTDSNASNTSAQRSAITIPWFALGFVLVAGIHSLGVLPAPLVAVGVQLDTVLLTLAMAALGLTTHIAAVRAAGTKPLLLALVLFGWLLGAGLLLNLWLPQWF